jgi:polyisoprenoid-binding protein YceI
VTTRAWITGAGAATVVLVVALIGGWYFIIRGDVPAAVNLAEAVSAATSDGTAEAGGDSTPEPPPSTTSDATSTVAAVPTSPVTAEPEVGLAGDWVLVAGSQSFVGYRVREELAQIGATTAVGRSADISALLSFDGTSITAVEVEANLAALRSDDTRRDRTLGRQALQTNTFPTATFSLTAPILLETEPVEGVPIAVMAIGDLTLHGVTRQVSIELEGQLVENQVVVVGSTEILFSDYDIDAPSAQIVLSVADNGIMEFQLSLERA